VLPVVAFAWDRIGARRTVGASLKRVTPCALVVIVWAAAHPGIGGLLLAGAHPALEPRVQPAWKVAARTLLVPLDLDHVPAPERGWPRAAALALAGIVCLVAMVALGARAERHRAAADADPAEREGGPRPDADAGVAAPARGARGDPGRFGVAWALCGWLPLLIPVLVWASYYALLGAFGAWLALGVALRRRPARAALAIAVLGLLRAAAADTPSGAWPTEWYQRRVAARVAVARDDLRRKFPRFPPHARLYFAHLPVDVDSVGENVGTASPLDVELSNALLWTIDPTVRVWYSDTTLHADFAAHFRPRRPGEPAGRDFFFRYDPDSGWVALAGDRVPTAPGR
jgi:hypothetical protein